jgi:hypothetical protein
MRVTKCYYVLDRETALVVASLPWKEAQELYGPYADRYVAYRVTKAGRRQVKHLCSGLDASVRENDDALDALRRTRRSLHNTDLLPPHNRYQP